ncbi:MAG TPA: hypothetical protein VF157_06230 [Chloroflexota bacterium]
MTFFFRRLFPIAMLTTAALSGAGVARASTVSATPTIVYTAFHSTITSPDQSASASQCAIVRGCYSVWLAVTGFTPGDQIVQAYSYPGGSGSGWWMLTASPYSYFAVVGAPCPASGAFQGTLQDALSGDTAAFSVPVDCTRVRRN